MGIHQGTGTISAELALNGRPLATSPVIVHQDTLLESLEHAIPESRFVVATDDSDSVVGLISSDQIHERLRTANVWERRRWAEMPVGSLIHSLASSKGSVAIDSMNSATECTAIAEHGHLVGIAIQGDIFLSWKRLQPLLSGASADALTGLVNRLAFERRLQEEWQRAMRTGCSIGILVIDLDRFKAINDEYGHQAGDDVIRRVAGRLEESLRSYDLVARYGGDEFTVLCLGCGQGEIEIPIRRILMALNHSSTAWQGLPAAASVSVGAAVRHDSFADSDPTDLFLAADRCLYQAKKSRGAAYCLEFSAAGPLPVRPISCRDDQVSLSQDISLASHRHELRK